MKTIFLILLILPSLCFAEDSICKNTLGTEKSPYLLQHKNNPICWRPWGEEVFLEAKKMKKPIFVSIGYSTCYWCHVMEKEVFNKEEIAKILNSDFISIKVDREERLDIDKIYMDALEVMTGERGWPLNIFINHDKQPFYGGTYFDKKEFNILINSLSDSWKNNPQKIKSAAKQFRNILIQSPINPSIKKISDDILKKSAAIWLQQFDKINGGFGDAPKFPPAVALSSLMRTYRRSNDPNILKILSETLDKMSKGGIYDHVGGGFHRYSTDKEWLIPHFEKMLYNNALLATTYFEAYQLTKKNTFKDIAIEILDYILSRMTSANGGFYSAEDAGDISNEGNYYLWETDEIKKILTPKEFNLFNMYFNFHKKNNFNSKNIISIKSDLNWREAKNEKINLILGKISHARNERKNLSKDKKILTSWNALAISAFTKGFQVTDRKEFLAAAKKSALFIKDNLFKNGGLKRRYIDGQTHHNAYLEDYAFFIESLINIYETDFDPLYLTFAKELQDIQDSLFWDNVNGGYYFSTNKDILVRNKEFHDTSLPSANSTSLLNLQRLYGFYFKEGYKNKKEKLFSLFLNISEANPVSFAKALHAFDFELDHNRQIAVISNNNNLPSFFHKDFLPNKSLAVGHKGKIPLLNKKKMIKDKRTFYVCRDRVCKLPTTNINIAKDLVRELKKIE